MVLDVLFPEREAALSEDSDSSDLDSEDASDPSCVSLDGLTSTASSTFLHGGGSLNPVNTASCATISSRWTV